METFEELSEKTHRMRSGERDVELCLFTAEQLDSCVPPDNDRVSMTETCYKLEHELNTKGQS